MYNELKVIAKLSYKSYRIAFRPNYLHLTVNSRDKKLELKFKRKPPSFIRNEIRTRNFRWSRKYRYWHSYLNKNQIDNIRKIYQFISKY